jgi:multicomponent Na+:H+ antiporter subunit G
MFVVSDVLLAFGCLMMLWGTLNLLRDLSFIVKLHILGVSDTLGAMLVVVGLVLRYPERISHLGIAFAALLFWGPLITFVMAKGLLENTEWDELK